MKTLELIGLTESFEMVSGNKGKEIYYNKATNNMIIFLPYDKGITAEDIYNGMMSNESYTYLMSTLNNSTDIVVVWSKVEGTTSDYEIYYDIDPSTLLGVDTESTIQTLTNLINDEKTSSFKYSQVKDGTQSPINLDAYKNNEDQRLSKSMKVGELKVLGMRFVSTETASIKYFLKLDNGFAKGELIIPCKMGEAYKIFNNMEKLLLEEIGSSLNKL